MFAGDGLDTGLTKCFCFYTSGLVALVCLALVWAVEGSDDVLVPDVARVESVDMAVGGGNDAGSGGGAALAGVATHSQYVTVTNCGDIR